MFIKVTAIDEVDEGKDTTYINTEHISSIKWNQDRSTTEVLLTVGALLDVTETPDEILEMIINKRIQRNIK